MMRLVISLAATSAIGSVLAVSSSNNKMESNNYPVASEQWVSVSKSMSFQPAQDWNPNALRQRRSLSYFEDSFADGMETQYNDYAQAWRLLGFYTECQAAAAAQRRKLEDNGEDAAQDDGAQDGGEQNDQADDANDGSYCKRYLLWAAYVDLDYEGHGLMEYQIYNTATKSWDKTACNAGTSGRCAKMDCHQSGSHFKLLGFFREEYPVNFLNSLLQSQGSCTWADDTLTTVTNVVEWLPQQCTQTQVVAGNNQIYIDLKPQSGGGVDIGLYTDAGCSTEYNGSATTVDKVLYSLYGQSISSKNEMDTLNTALDAFKVCTPCRTFDLSYVEAANEEDEQDQGNNNNNNNGDPNNQYFVCQDTAGYNGVNQCMLFAKNSGKAAFREVSLASSQGTITRTYGAADFSKTWWQSWGFLLMSLLVFVFGILMFLCVAVKRKRITSDDKSRPLMSRQ